jgi:hypothetical protein
MIARRPTVRPIKTTPITIRPAAGLGDPDGAGELGELLTDVINGPDDTPLLSGMQ